MTSAFSLAATTSDAGQLEKIAVLACVESNVDGCRLLQLSQGERASEPPKLFEAKVADPSPQQRWYSLVYHADVLEPDFGQFTGRKDGSLTFCDTNFEAVQISSHRDKLRSIPECWAPRAASCMKHKLPQCRRGQ